MNRFFTGNGDDGITGLLGMKRVVKCDLQIETLGTLDELSAALGLARALLDAKTNEDLKGIQRMISRIMSEVAAIPDNVDQFISVNEDAIISLEKMINEYADQIQLPNEFILPGDTPCSAAISIARAAARKAERRLVELRMREPELRKIIIQYLNRLSSFLFVLEIHTIQRDTNETISLVKKKEK